MRLFAGYWCRLRSKRFLRAKELGDADVSTPKQEWTEAVASAAAEERELLAMSTASTTVAGNGKLGMAILKPFFQAGFAGLCVVLLGIIVWRMQCADEQFSRLMLHQAKTNTVIEHNTSAIRDLSRVVMDKL